MRVSNPGETFTLSATVTNAGEGDSPATTLRYYRSTNDTISPSDTEVAAHTVSAFVRIGDEREVHLPVGADPARDVPLRRVRGRRGGRVGHLRQLFVIRTGRRGDAQPTPKPGGEHVQG